MACSSKSEDAYIFKRNVKSSFRLDYNHWLFTRLSGYLLHPKIPTEYAGLRVADIGTGTGLWLIEVSGELPTSATLDGFDISPEQYPPQAWLPANVHFHVHDAFKAFPQEHIGVYDIVHLRALTTILNKENIKTLFENVMALLKPGGHLQWFEPNTLLTRVRVPDPSTTSTATQNIVALMQHPRPGISHDWIPHIGAILSLLDSESVAYERIQLPDTYRMQWSQSTMVSHEEFWARKIDTAEDRAEVLRESIQAVKLLEEEIQKGVSIDTEWFCIVRRKSLSG